MSDMSNYEEAVKFHGHSCPGLAIGIRVAEAALKRLTSDRAEDEELVAVVENDSCAVDAVQVLTGCTFGKGNFFFKDHGKQAYEFHNRTSGEAVRIYAEPFSDADGNDQRFADLRTKGEMTPDERAELDRLTKEKVDRILNTPEETFMTITPIETPAPARASIFASIRCDNCGEKAMETRTVKRGGETLCLGCA